MEWKNCQSIVKSFCRTIISLKESSSKRKCPIFLNQSNLIKVNTKNGVQLFSVRGIQYYQGRLRSQSHLTIRSVSNHFIQRHPSTTMGSTCQYRQVKQVLLLLFIQYKDLTGLYSAQTLFIDEAIDSCCCTNPQIVGWQVFCVAY